ncbi:Vsp/OspC family lipoprotein [Borreliella lusitaniae]|uniref:Vsp/OspC family lipoprotein n=1 Tax=Borreliella lusitaniae TaxID=100177 RepID=UPI002648EAD2|nr:Vsp/OspC family lipoprotein [Borreliella lusitaniae]WKC84860.1 Vsp/OspC family lipoprotein [Borreliella lusitaniae]WMB90953.1 outer surface protein C [Borreliella lusitaniae]
MKKNTLGAILMTLFLFISCNNSGESEKNSASTTNASLKMPNLTEISKKITDSNAFALAVKEVETLLLSIDELATKAKGKKIDHNGLGDMPNHIGSLLAGAYAIAALITEKLSGLKSEKLKRKIDEAKKCSEDFTAKLRENEQQFVDGADDLHVEHAILRTKNPGHNKGALELKKLFESVESLAKEAKKTVTNSIQELTSPVVAETPNKP